MEAGSERLQDPTMVERGSSAVSFYLPECLALIKMWKLLFQVENLDADSLADIHLIRVRK